MPMQGLTAKRIEGTVIVIGPGDDEFLKQTRFQGCGCSLHAKHEGWSRCLRQDSQDVFSNGTQEEG